MVAENNTPETNPDTRAANARANRTPQKRTVGPVTRASSTGSGVAAAIVTVFAWIMSSTAGVDLPEGVQTAVTVILVFAGGLIGGYIPRPDNSR